MALRAMWGRRAVASVALLGSLAAARCDRGSQIQIAGFWFDHVTFELAPSETERIGGPLTDDEAAAIRSTALAELRTAYAGIDVAFAETPEGLYRVAVVQDLSGEMTRGGGFSDHVGESRSLGPFGGRGMVSFSLLATNAIHYAPPGATRPDIVSGMGRGIGRAAAHEFAHQILPGIDLHHDADKESYEYGNADRAAQYYGTLHWSKVRPEIARKFGGRWWGPPSPPV